MAVNRDRAGSDPPRYYRVTVILSDRDEDLKRWCWEHPDTCTATIRDALRAHLNKGGVPPSRKKEHAAAPARKEQPRRDPPKPAAPTKPADPTSEHHQTPPSGELFVRDSERPDKASPRGQSTPSDQGGDAAGSPSEGIDEVTKKRLQRLVQGNKEFS